jgi:diaminopimelate decarboxylase
MRTAEADLAAEFGTPLYVYDFDVIDRRVADLRAVLPDRFALAYAVKANPSLGVVAGMARLGLGADVASVGELETALRAGIAGSGVVFTGPGKRDDELRVAVQTDIRAITVESFAELARLERIAAHAHRRVSILLRMAASPVDQRGGVRVAGECGVNKFGMDEQDLVRAASHAAGSPHLDLLGIHAFGMSNVMSAAAWADHAQATIDFAIGLADRVGFDLRLVDVGGGLGIPYDDNEAELDLSELGRRLSALDDGRTVLVEPGRFLVGPAGIYVTRIVDRKVVRGRTVVVLDGGIHHLLRPALIGRAHRLRLIPTSPSEDRPDESVAVVGPLCTGLDVLAEDVVLPSPQPGDLLIVHDTGAYGYTESMPLFLSHSLPAEVAISDGRVALLRPRIEPRTWLAAQMIPSWQPPLDHSARRPRPASLSRVALASGPPPT